MSDVLFGQSYFLRFDPKLWQAMQPYPPLGALVAAAVVRQQGYETAFFDAMLADSETDWQAALNRHNPTYAVLFEDNFNYLSKMCLLRMRQAAYTMIAMARQKGCTVIVAGADASDHAAEYLSAGAHFVIIGEGEQTLVELLDCLAGRSLTPMTAIPGLAFIDTPSNGHSGEKGNLVMTPHRPELRVLDALPIAAWDLIDIERYREVWRSRHGYFSMNMVSTRGCPFHCNWCAKPIWGQRYHVRSPENVASELHWLHDHYHPDHIWFMDDIFGLKPGWMESFAEQLEKLNLRMPFKCLNRADLLLRPGEIAALQKAGCRTVWIGAESGSQKVLDAMDKGVRIEQIKDAARLLRQAHIQVGFFLQFGYPGETLADIEQTLQMVRACLPDDIGMSVSYPLPGTRFYEAVKSQLRAQQNWVDSNDLAMLYQGPFSTEFYRQLHTTLHREFRARRAWLRLSSSFRHAPKIDGSSTSQPVAFLKTISIFVKNIALLPIERWKLRRLTHRPHSGIGRLPPLMAPEDAAQPSTQSES